MTPYEKATQLVATYQELTQDPEVATLCALQILKQLQPYLTPDQSKWWNLVQEELTLLKGNPVFSSLPNSPYREISTLSKYTNLLNTGVLLKLYPELNGDWLRDKLIIQNL